MLFLNSIATIFCLMAVLASLLVLGNYWFHVEDDPRISAVEDMLPHTNCGACGYPGCHAFAEALVSGKALPAGCTVGSAADHVRIAS